MKPWKILLFFVAVSVPSCSLAVTKNKDFKIYDFSKGVDTYHDPTTLPDGFVQDSLNVLFDDKAPVTKRFGYTIAWSTTSAYSFTGLWSYTDSTNTSWQIARSSTQITASNLAGSIVKIATVSASNIVNETNAFGFAYFVDQTQGVYYWNGTSTTYVSGSPQGSIITTFHNRLWVTGAAVPNGNQLYGSKFGDGNTWATGVNATDPVQFSIGLNDNFDNLTAEYVYLDTLYLFKHYSVFALYGFDQTNFQNSQLTQECGCIDGGSIQTYMGSLKFLSLRGVENFDGYHCTRISDPIKNKIDPAIQVGGFSQQSWVQSSLSDWAAGTFSANNNISTMTVATAMQWRGAGKDTIASDFNSGVLIGLSFNSPGLQISTDVANVKNNSFESGTTNWTFGTNSTVQGSMTGDHCFGTLPKDGSKELNWGNIFSSTPATIQVALLHCLDNAILSSATVTTGYTGTCAWNQVTLPAPSDRQCAFVRVQNTTNPETILTSDDFLTNGNAMTFWWNSDSTSFGGPLLFLDFWQNGRTDNENNSQTSRVFDTGKTSSKVVPKVAWTINGSTPSFVLQSSPDNVTFTDVTTSTGIASTVNRYVRYLSTWTFAPNLDFKSSWQSVDLQPVIFTSTWTSACHSIGNIRSWGNLSIIQDLTGGGSTAFTFCSSANSNCTSASCGVITPNSQITIATNTFAQVITTFTATVTTQTATVNSITAQWFTGNVSIPVWSTIWDNRYWLSLTTNTVDSTNDAVVVLNSRGAWTTFDIKAGAFTQYKNSLYHADALSSGNIYLDNQAFSDNGNPINSFVHTRTESLGDLTTDDYLYALYPSALNTGNCTMSVQYIVDKSTNTYSLSSPLLNEFGTMSSVRLPFPIDSSHQVFGQSIDFIVGTNDNSCAWSFYGLEGLYKSRPLQ